MKRNLFSIAIYSFGLITTVLVCLYELGVFSKPIIILNTVAKINYPKVLAQTQTLSTEGFLSHQGSMLILKVSDNYIQLLYPLLDKYLDPLAKKCLRPSPLKLGGHITLFKNSNLKFNSDQKFHFQLNGIVQETVIKKFNNLVVHETWYEIAVISPELTTAFNDKITPDRLHISIAVSKYIEGTHICYF